MAPGGEGATRTQSGHTLRESPVLGVWWQWDYASTFMAAELRGVWWERIPLGTAIQKAWGDTPYRLLRDVNMNGPKLGYKLFNKRRDGTIGPLFINRRQRIPLEIWIQAEDHPTKGYAHRPGWHVLEAPHAPPPIQER